MSMQFFDYSGYDYEPIKYPKTEDDVFNFVENIIRINRPCGDTSKYKSVKLNIHTITGFISKFDSFPNMKAVECFIQNSSMLEALSKSLVRDVLTPLPPAQKTMEKNRNVSSGSYGDTFTVWVGETKKSGLSFICKTIRDATRLDKRTFILEYFIGACIVNQFRKFCPTFCYTLGEFECGDSTDKKKLCGSAPYKKPYIILEHVKGETLGDFVKKSDDEKTFASCLLQLLLALEIAQREARFCHYDLSINNVMVTDTLKNFSIALDDKVYVFNSKRAVIIDYGFSCATYKGKLISSRHVNYLPSKFQKHPFLIQGFDILYFLTNTCYIPMGNKVMKYVESIFKVLFPEVKDPYKIFDQKNMEERKKLFEREFVGNYATSELAQLTPGILLERLLRDDRTTRLISGLVKVEDRTTLDITPVSSIESVLDTAYVVEQQPKKFDCLSDFGSYILVTETLSKLPANSLDIPGLTAFRDINEQTFKREDAELLGNFFKMFINQDTVVTAREIMSITLGSGFSRDKLAKFLQDSLFIQFIEYYLKIYYLIRQLKLTGEPYDGFVRDFMPSHSFRFFKEYGALLFAARRWVYTLFENVNINTRYLSQPDIELCYKMNIGVLKRVDPDGRALLPQAVRDFEAVISTPQDIIFITEKDRDSPSADTILLSLLDFPFKILLVFTKNGIWQFMAEKRSARDDVAKNVLMRNDIDTVIKGQDIINSLQAMFFEFGFTVTFRPGKTPEYFIML